MTKPTKWYVRTAKSQISLGICPVWPESSLSAGRKLRPLAIHWAHSEDSDQTGRPWSDLSLHWAQRSFRCFCHEAAHLFGTQIRSKIKITWEKKWKDIQEVPQWHTQRPQFSTGTNKKGRKKVKPQNMDTHVDGQSATHTCITCVPCGGQ